MGRNDNSKGRLKGVISENFRKYGEFVGTIYHGPVIAHIKDSILRSKS
ncbi:hypothetical protein [Ligilactobacillus sp.]